MRSSDRSWKLILEIDGVVVPTDTGLTRTPQGWTYPSPVFCHQGHRFTPGKAIVGYRQCSRGGHRSYQCALCGDIVLLPPPGPDCDHRDFDERPTGTARPPTASE